MCLKREVSVFVIYDLLLSKMNLAIHVILSNAKVVHIVLVEMIPLC